MTRECVANPYISLHSYECIATFTSSLPPSCTADSSATLRATAPVRSLVHVWPCSAPLQPLLRLPFPATLEFPSHSGIHSLSFSVHISHFFTRDDCNLYCDFLSQPLPSLSFSVHISHFIPRKRSLSCPISHSPPRFPYAFLTALCPFCHICCLDTGFECLPLVRLPFWGSTEVPLESPHSVLSKEPKSTPI
jgi:hypothetical protein